MSYAKTFSKLRRKKEKALVPFVVIGDPDYNTSLKIVKTIVESGANVLELGFPFSDPIADGPTIQAADVRSLKKGINTDKCLKFIKKVRLTVLPRNKQMIAGCTHPRPAVHGGIRSRPAVKAFVSITSSREIPRGR